MLQDAAVCMPRSAASHSPSRVRGMRIRNGAAVRQIGDAQNQAQLVSWPVRGRSDEVMSIAEARRTDMREIQSIGRQASGVKFDALSSAARSGRACESAGRPKGRIRDARTKKKRKAPVVWRC